MKVVGAEPTGLDKIEAEVHAAAREVGAMVLPTVLQVQAPLVASIAADQIVALITFLKPRLIYMLPVEFDAEEDVLSHLEEQGDEEWLLSLPEVTSLIHRWRKYDGEAICLNIGMVADGVLHGLAEPSPWGERFNEEVEAIVPAIEQARDGVAAEERTRLKKRIAGKVASLVADPRFSAGKVGHAKRLVLARDLFPGLDDDELDELVTEAENIYWLKTGKS